MTLKRALEKALKRDLTATEVSDKVKAALPKHLKIGAEGEVLAVDYLVSQGYEVIARNVRYRFGEIDIVARDRDEIVFAEVRTRSLGYILPADCTVGSDKLKKLLKSAYTWTEKNNYEGFWRIDLIAITVDVYGNNSIEHIKNITGAAE